MNEFLAHMIYSSIMLRSALEVVMIYQVKISKSSIDFVAIVSLNDESPSLRKLFNNCLSA